MRPTTPRVIAAAAIAATCSTSAFGAAAVQPYPSRPLRIIVPFPPSGGTDIATRLIAQKLTDSFGQTVVVDNRPGAGANIGIGLAAKAAPDGYTILVVSSAFTVNPTLYAKPPYDAHKDFQPLTCIGSSANALAVTPSFPAKGFKEAARRRMVVQLSVTTYPDGVPSTVERSM